MEQANNIMKESANELRNFNSKEKPENIEIDEKGNVLRFSVTVDGTLQKRGHSYKIRIAFVISVRIG